MEEALTRIIMLLKVIHNENMTIYKMFLGKDADELITKYNEQFNEVLEIDMEK